eukprot:sb/3475559/
MVLMVSKYLATFGSLAWIALGQETTGFSKTPIKTHYLGHVTGYQPIRDQYFLILSVPTLGADRSSFRRVSQVLASTHHSKTRSGRCSRRAFSRTRTYNSRKRDLRLNLNTEKVGYLAELVLFIPS